MSNTVITIGRQFGSGGYEIASILAKKRNVKLYDKELIALAAKESGYCREVLDSHDEKPTSSFLYSLVSDTYSMNGFGSALMADMPLNQKVFLAQFDAIKKLADRESCVIVGRCAEYALEGRKNCIHIFICADMDARVRRIAEIHDLTDAKAKELIQKTDKGRANYHNYYASKKWGVASTYDLCINSTRLGISGTAGFILQYIQTYENQNK